MNAPFLRMNCDRLSHEHLPYEILRQEPDIFGKMRPVQLRTAYSTEEERDAVFDKLNHKGVIKYSKHTNQHELILQAKAMGRLK